MGFKRGSPRGSPRGVIFVFVGFFTHRCEVSAFSFKTSPLTVRPTHESSHPSRTVALGVGAATSSGTLGDQIASIIVNSPIYPLLTLQAKNTMKTSAENIGIDWDGEVTRLQKARDWDAALEELLTTSSVEVPDYFKRPFHTYPEGNLCWDAAFEQQLASKSVGIRNFPNDPKEGERLLRESYHRQMERLGVVVEDGGLVVDMGCGTGSSTRALARCFPGAERIVGFDLSPHMVLAGRFLGEEDETADPRAELNYGAAEKTGLPGESASLVSLCLVMHELSSDARRQIFREAHRVLRPGGSFAIMEMDPCAPGYVKLRNNPMVFSILRSTEPYLDVYFAEASQVDAELYDAGFSTVRKSGATGRHMAVVAVKGGTFDLRGTDEERDKADTHVQSHKAGVWFNNPVGKQPGGQ